MDEASAVETLGVDVLLSSLAHPIKKRMVHSAIMFFM
jgi:hypothetical protein